MTSQTTPNRFQEELNYNKDKARFEELLKKHFSGQGLDESESDEFSSLGSEMFGKSSSGSLSNQRNFTPNRMDSSSTPSTLSSQSSENTLGSNVSKASSGLARVLQENRSMKEQFINVRLKDVEEELFDMDKTFNTAALYNATFLLFMKYLFT
jgi:hypothetical protein